MLNTILKVTEIEHGKSNMHVCLYRHTLHIHTTHKYIHRHVYHKKRVVVCIIRNIFGVAEMAQW